MKSAAAVVCLILYISTLTRGYYVPKTEHTTSRPVSLTFNPSICPRKNCPKFVRYLPSRCLRPTIYLYNRNICVGCYRNTCIRSPSYRWYQFEYV